MSVNKKTNLGNILSISLDTNFPTGLLFDINMQSEQNYLHNTFAHSYNQHVGLKVSMRTLRRCFSVRL